MSVHGEFDRYLKDTAHALRAEADPDLDTIADDLDTIIGDPGDALEVRARRVLNGPLGESESAWQGFAPVAEPARGLIAISRIILGR